MSFELDDRIERLRSLGVQVVQVERLASCGSWLAGNRILLLDRAREDWEQVSVCDGLIKKEAPNGASPSLAQPRQRRATPPVLSGPERAAEVAAVIAHCKATLADAGDEGVTMTALKADLILYNPGATNDAITLLRIDPEVTETRERRPSNTGNGGRYTPWQVVLRLVQAEQHTDGLDV